MNKNLTGVLSLGLAVTTLCTIVTGCGTGSVSSAPVAPVGIPGVAIHGQVHGGQQPITQSSIYLYAAGNTGYGSAFSYTTGTNLLGNHVITTDSNGNFNITSDYTCPTASTEVYIEAVGGYPVLGSAANPNVTLFSAVGTCSQLQQATYVTINEITTVASAFALAPFATGPSNIGTSSTNAVGLTNAFNTVTNLVNSQYGTANTAGAAGATLPSATLITLANIIGSCVNTPGGSSAGSGNPCSVLFTNATPPGSSTPPTDTLTAALNIAHYPGQNVTNLYTLAGKTPPFSGGLTTQPNDFTLSVRYTGNASLSAATVPIGIAADQSGNIWVANNGTENSAGTGYTTNPSLVELSPLGALIATHSKDAYLAVAIDLNGNAWTAPAIARKGLAKTTPGAAGTTTTYAAVGGQTAGDLPSIAVDGSGNVWSTSANLLTEVNSSGAAVSTTAGYSGGGLSSGVGVAITPH